MKFRAPVIFALTAIALAQNAPPPKSVTVPITLDHNRVVINADLALPDGSTERIRTWVDTGNPDLWMSRRVANLMGLTVDCGPNVCTATGTPHDLLVGGFRISFASLKQAKILVKSEQAQAVMIPGMNAEMNLPSTILRDYAIVVALPERKFTIAVPGGIKFNGLSSKIFVNPENGLVQVPSKIDNKSYNLGLDVGASISFLSQEVFEKLAASHPAWLRMTGAVGPANMWGMPDEPQWKLLRLERLQYGPQFLSGTVMVMLPPDAMADVTKRAGTPTAGLLGSNALLTSAVGIDYARKLAYFEVDATFKPPDFDVVGITLRPRADGSFTVIAIAEIEGKPSVPEVQAGDRLIAVNNIPTAGQTLGQVWSTLRGNPGQERTLTIERSGKSLTVVANVQHFLGETPENTEGKGTKKKK
jgi:hypothetical protein